MIDSAQSVILAHGVPPETYRGEPNVARSRGDVRHPAAFPDAVRVTSHPCRLTTVVLYAPSTVTVVFDPGRATSLSETFAAISATAATADPLAFALADAIALVRRVSALPLLVPRPLERSIVTARRCSSPSSSRARLDETTDVESNPNINKTNERPRTRTRARARALSLARLRRDSRSRASGRVRAPSEHRARVPRPCASRRDARPRRCAPCADAPLGGPLRHCATRWGEDDDERER